MEAEYVRERRRRRTVVLLGILLAVLAAGATYYLVTRSAGAPAAAQKTIVVAAVEIPERSVIEADQVRTQAVTDSPALQTVATNPDLVIGQVARVRIPAGAPIFPIMYGQGTAAGLAIIPIGEELTEDSPAWRAVSVLIPDDRAVAGQIRAGDRVDLFATVEIEVFDPTGTLSETALLPEGYYTGFTTKVTLTNIEVLLADSPNELYVLRVDEHQAEEIAHIQGMGAENSFTISLRAQADARDIDRSGYGETTNRLIEQYNYPIPQILFLDTYPQPSPQPPPFVPGGPPPAPSTPAPPAASPSPAASPAASP